MKLLLLIISFLTFGFAKEQTIVLGAGCFWGVEKSLESLKGVKDAVSGYAGGDFDNPTYGKVLAHRNMKGKNYAEVVRVTYDDNIISTREILEHFWEIHDPTQGDRQGNDWGNNYRSAIFYTTNKQKEIAIQTKREFQKLLNSAGYGKITTEIAPLKNFYKAEEKHQDYLKKHPKGYCPNHATGVKFKKRVMSALKPLGGKEIIVVDAKDCPYCEVYKKEVLNSYRGTLPLRVAKEYQLKEFNLKSRVRGTPTTILIKDGKEVFRHTGALSKDQFYKLLGEFKLGSKSEAYKVAFAKGTDSRFCKQYKIFKNTGDGVFIDKLSGQPLFDTKDRFNSHSGWLSFYKPIDGSVVYKDDNSYGMHRVEVIAKVSGAHLGHVFDRADGKKRYCINATVLEFVPRDKFNKRSINGIQ